MIRMYFQNVNGLHIADDGIDILDAMYHMETIRADVFGFVETKLDCQDKQIQAILHKQKKKVSSHCKLASCNSDLSWHSSNKPGRAMLGITGPLVGQVRQTLLDDLGKWGDWNYLDTTDERC